MRASRPCRDSTFWPFLSVRFWEKCQYVLIPKYLYGIFLKFGLKNGNKSWKNVIQLFFEKGGGLHSMECDLCLKMGTPKVEHFFYFDKTFFKRPLLIWNKTKQNNLALKLKLNNLKCIIHPRHSQWVVHSLFPILDLLKVKKKKWGRKGDTDWQASPLHLHLSRGMINKVERERRVMVLFTLSMT